MEKKVEQKANKPEQQPVKKEQKQETQAKKEAPKTAPAAQPKPIFAETKQQTQQTTETKKTPDKIAAINDMREQAKFLYNSNKLEESKKLFNQIPDAEKISDDWLFLANIAQDNGKDIDAVFYLKKAIQADDKNYKAHYNLGNIYFADNKINMALAEYRKVLRIKKIMPMLITTRAAAT